MHSMLAGIGKVARTIAKGCPGKLTEVACRRIILILKNITMNNSRKWHRNKLLFVIVDLIHV